MRLFTLAGFVCLFAACGGGNDQAKAPESAAPQTFADQVALGQTIFADKCAKCHGDAGQGTDKAPRVVGLQEGALPLDPPPERKFRKNQFKTVGDVADFAMANMPADNPGSLTPEQYLAVLAFDLKANGINLDKKLDRETANTLTIPR